MTRPLIWKTHPIRIFLIRNNAAYFLTRSDNCVRTCWPPQHHAVRVKLTVNQPQGSRPLRLSPWRPPVTPRGAALSLRMPGLPTQFHTHIRRSTNVLIQPYFLFLSLTSRLVITPIPLHRKPPPPVLTLLFRLWTFVQAILIGDVKFSLDSSGGQLRRQIDRIYHNNVFFCLTAEIQINGELLIWKHGKNALPTLECKGNFMARTLFPK